MPDAVCAGAQGGTYLTKCSFRAATAAHRAGQAVSDLHPGAGFTPVNTWRAHQGCVWELWTNGV